jgi:hypothetical protein
MAAALRIIRLSDADSIIWDQARYTKLIVKKTRTNIIPLIPINFPASSEKRQDEVKILDFRNTKPTYQTDEAGELMCHPCHRPQGPVQPF